MSWLSNLARGVRDVFDANTVSDQNKRLAAGQPRYYQQQQPKGNLIQRNVITPSVDSVKGVLQIPNNVYNSTAGHLLRASISYPALGIANITDNRPMADIARFRIKGNLQGAKQAGNQALVTLNDPQTFAAALTEKVGPGGFKPSPSEAPKVNITPSDATPTISGKKAPVPPKKTQADLAIQQRLNERPANLRAIEQSKTNMPDSKRLNLAKGDTGQAGLRMDPAARGALLKKTQAAAKSESVFRSESPNRYGVGQAELGSGLYTGSRDVAGRLQNGKIVTDGLYEYRVNPKANILDSSSSTFKSIDAQASNHPSLKGLDGRAWQQAKADITTKLVREQGYDGVRRGTNQVVDMSGNVLTPVSKNAPTYKKPLPKSDVINPEAPDFLQVKKGALPPPPEPVFRVNEPLVTKKGAKSTAPAGTGTIPLEKLGPAEKGPARGITGKVMKDPAVQDVFNNLSKAQRLASSEQSLTAAAIERAAKKTKVNPADPGVRERLQTGAPANPSEQAFFQAVKKETDRVFPLQQQIDPTTPYNPNYLPGNYAADAATFENALNQLRTKTGSNEAKTFKTYGEAAQFGLQPKFKTIQETVAANAGEAQKAVLTKQAVDSGLKSGVFDTKPLTRDWKQVDGLYTGTGDPIFADGKLANKLNTTFQPTQEGIGTALDKTAKASSMLQQTALTGGVPNTYFNAFGISQSGLQLTGYLRPSALKDMYFAASKGLTQERFTKPTSVAEGLSTPDFVREVQQRGGNIGSISSDATTMNQGLGRRVANKVSGEQATFQQLQPNFQLSVAEATYKKYVKKLGHEGALDLAAKTVNRTSGFVDEVGRGRSVNTRNATTSAFFAPRYREAIVNQLANAVKAWAPKNIKDPSFRYSRRFALGLLGTATAYDAINYQLNGHHMWENRNGQELSVQIPTGEKDDKGNQPVINIPLFPSVLTLPRSLVNSVIAGVRGDGKAVIKEAGKTLSTPLQIGTQLVSNRDYFDRPIFNDKATAQDQGIAPDNALVAAGKIGAYAGKQLLPGPGKAVLDKLGIGRDKPVSWGQAAAQATEAPIRFGKQLKPSTEAYFNDRKDVYGGLDLNDKSVWDTIHPPITKNVNGDYINEKTVWGGAARASAYLDNPKVLAAENEMARRAVARGEKVDPLFGQLSGQQQLIALTMDTLPPKDPNKTILRNQNPWYQAYSDARQAFFDGLPPGDPNKPKGPITYPEPDAQTASLQKAYYQITDGKMKYEFLKNNPDVADQFAKEEQYSRAVRAAKNLPQYDKYPEATPQVQKLIDTYSALPQKEAGGKSKIRSAWIKAHPNEWQQMTDQFSKQAQYNLQQDASLAAFEGQDLTEKGIKAIGDLAKSLGMSSGGYGGYGGYGSGGGGKKAIPDYSSIISGVSGLNKKISTAKVGKGDLVSRVKKPGLKQITAKRIKT